MEMAAKAMEFASKAANNNTVINVFLVGSFAFLSMRSVNQQKEIETLESQKESLVKSNKSLKQTMWDWKQQLYAEASASDKKPIVPLSTLRSIYGEAPTAAESVGGTEMKHGKAPVTKILI